MTWLSPNELAGAAQDLHLLLKSMFSEKMSKNDFFLTDDFGERNTDCLTLRNRDPT